MNIKDYISATARKDKYEEIYDLGIEIGEMIYEARLSKGLTQEDLARLIDTKQPSIARIENGSGLPSLTFLEKIAKAFNTRLLPPRFEFQSSRKLVAKTLTEDSIWVMHTDNNKRNPMIQYVTTINSNEEEISTFNTFNTAKLHA